MQLLVGNNNANEEKEQIFDPPIIATKIRFIPYTTHIRTVCMRVELYGCPWNGKWNLLLNLHSCFLDFLLPKKEKSFCFHIHACTQSWWKIALSIFILQKYASLNKKYILRSWNIKKIWNIKKSVAFPKNMCWRCFSQKWKIFHVLKKIFWFNLID